MTLDYYNFQSYVCNDTKLPQTAERFVMARNTEVQGESAVTLNYRESEERLGGLQVINRASGLGLPRWH